MGSFETGGDGDEAVLAERLASEKYGIGVERSSRIPGRESEGVRSA
jgi:hypothetical protein